MSSLLKAGEFSLARSRPSTESQGPWSQGDRQEKEASAASQHESLLEEAYQRAYEEGKAGGYRDGQAQAAREANRLLEEARVKADALIQESRPILLDLALGIAGKILRDEVTSRPEVIVGIVDNALKRVSGENSVAVKVNPRDVVVVEEGRDGLLDDNPSLKDLKVLEDSLVGPGGCVVEGSHGRVDATMDGQLARARTALAGEVAAGE